jgi:hypothetical protein
VAAFLANRQKRRKQEVNWRLANLEEMGNLYNIVVILDREFHNGREAARIKDEERRRQDSETGQAK